MTAVQIHVFGGQGCKIGYFGYTLEIHANHGSKCHLIIGHSHCDDQDRCEMLILITL